MLSLKQRRFYRLNRTITEKLAMNGLNLSKVIDFRSKTGLNAQLGRASPDTLYPTIKQNHFKSAISSH